MHEPDRLVGAAAAGTGDAGDGHREIGARMRERAARHGLGGLPADRAVIVERRRRHAQHLLLGLVRIGDEAAIDHVRRAGDFGQRAGHQPAGAGFGGRDFQAARAAGVEHGGGGRARRRRSWRAPGQPHRRGRIGGDAFAAAGEAEPLAGRRLHRHAADIDAGDARRCSRASRRDADRSCGASHTMVRSRCAIMPPRARHALDRERAGNGRTKRRAIADRSAENASRCRRRRARREWHRSAHAGRHRHRNGRSAPRCAGCGRRRSMT